MTLSTKLVTLAAALLILTSAGSASAAFFSAGTTPYSGANNCSGVQGGSGQAPIFASAACSPYAGATTAAEAYANYGRVGASAQVLGGTSASAGSSFQDLVRFTSTDPNAHFAYVQVQFELNGFLTADAGAPNFDVPNPTATADVRAQVYFNGAQLNFEREDSSSRFGNNITLRNDFGVVSGNPLDSGLGLLLVTQSFYVPLDANIVYAFALTSSANVFGPNAGASSMFFHTLGFAPGVNAFVLPDGVTANAGDYLVNNRLVTAGVPEPASWALMISGFGLAGVALRRRCHGQVALAV